MEREIDYDQEGDNAAEDDSDAFGHCVIVQRAAASRKVFSPFRVARLSPHQRRNAGLTRSNLQTQGKNHSFPIKRCTSVPRGTSCAATSGTSWGASLPVETMPIPIVWPAVTGAATDGGNL